MTTTDVRPEPTGITRRGDGLLPTPDRIHALDGLRAVAVYLVVAFHSGLTSFEGGFIGVDVFFVLSGFLITRLLLIEHLHHGRIDLPRFYARRARRLLPAAWIAIGATAVLYLGVATPFERAAVVGDARSALLYIANWHFIREGQDYFAESLESSPFLHLWSLSVEEQFYIVWPLIAVVLLRLWRRHPRAATVSLIVAALAGAAWAVVVAADDVVRAYYGTDTRAYQLLAGAALALIATRSTGTLRRMPTGVPWGSVLVAGVATLVVLATTFGFDPVDRGLLATVSTLVVIVAVIGSTAGTAAARSTLTPAGMLGSRPLVTLGNISYATYLWHWPVVILLGRVFQIGPRGTVVIVAVVSTGLAKLSMDLLERPVRRLNVGADRRSNLVTVGVAIVTTLALGLAVVPAILRSDVGMLRLAERPGAVAAEGAAPAAAPVGNDPSLGALPPPGADGPSTRPPAAADPANSPDTSLVAGPPADDGEPATGDARPTAAESDPPIPLPFGPAPTEPIPVPDDLGRGPVTTDFVEKSGCVNEVPTDVAGCVSVDGAGERILLIGDSHATKLNAAFNDHADANDLTMATVSGNGCPWQDGLLYRDALPAEGAKQFCRDQRDALYDWYVDDYDPDVVVIANHDQTTQAYGVVPRPERGTDPDLSGVQLIESASARSLDRLAGPGRRIVLLEPLPNAPFHPVNCLSAAAVVDECAFVVEQWPHVETPLLRALATERDGVSTVDMTPFACPHFPTCRPIVDGVLVREDPDHFDVRHTLRIAPALMSRLGL